MKTYNKKMIFAYFRNPAYCENLIERDCVKIDVINYAFAKIKNGEVDVSHLTNLRDVIKLKPKGLKIVIVLDGVSEETRCSFRLISSSEAAREKFSTSVCKIIEEYNLDGVDLDWEVPTGEIEIENFTLLVKNIRKNLDKLKEKKILSIAIFSSNFDKHYDLKTLKNYVDYFHIMTYGMGSKKITSHHSPLYCGELSKYSISDSVNEVIKRGVDKEKIVFGVPFFVRIGEIVPNGSQILNMPIIDGTFKAISNNKFLTEFKTINSFKEYYDEVSEAYYSFDGKTFASYDNPESIKNKCKFLVDSGLGGIMFWDYGHDKENGDLLDAIYKSLK